MTRLLKSYCIGHTLPLFAPPIRFDMLCPAPLGIPNELVVRDDRFGPGIDGGTLAEYSQWFGLGDLLASGDVVADELFLFQYRKFLSPILGGVDANAPWLRVLSPDTAPAVFPTPEQIDAYACRLAVGSVFDFGESIAANYARVHVVDDLVMFAAAIADSGALSEQDIRSFATLRGIIPSPAVCYLHADLFVRIVGILRRVWESFHPHYRVERTGYQRRVAGYLLERLHSYLLCKWLMDGTEPDIRVWHRYVVTVPAAQPSATAAPIPAMESL